MIFNTELAERVIGKIEANPDNWDQGSWHCGTSYCFAGWAAVLTQRFALNMTNAESMRYECHICEDFVLATVADNPYYLEDWAEMCSVHGLRGVMVVHMRCAAMTELGIESFAKALKLFDGSNTLDTIKTVVKDFASE